MSRESTRNDHLHRTSAVVNPPTAPLEPQNTLFARYSAAMLPSQSQRYDSQGFEQVSRSSTFPLPHQTAPLTRQNHAGAIDPSRQGPSERLYHYRPNEHQFAGPFVTPQTYHDSTLQHRAEVPGTAHRATAPWTSHQTQSSIQLYPTSRYAEIHARNLPMVTNRPYPPPSHVNEMQSKHRPANAMSHERPPHQHYHKQSYGQNGAQIRETLPHSPNPEIEVKGLLEQMRLSQNKNPAAWNKILGEMIRDTQPRLHQPSAVTTVPVTSVALPVHSDESVDIGIEAPLRIEVVETQTPSMLANATAGPPDQIIQHHKSANSTWTADKKSRVITAAIQWITSDPANQGKLISEKQISSMLDQNPSYVEFCEMLDSQGLQIQRSGLATALCISLAASRSPNTSHIESFKASSSTTSLQGTHKEDPVNPNAETGQSTAVVALKTRDDQYSASPELQDPRLSYEESNTNVLPPNPSHPQNLSPQKDKSPTLHPHPHFHLQPNSQQSEKQPAPAPAPAPPQEQPLQSHSHHSSAALPSTLTPTTEINLQSSLESRETAVAAEAAVRQVREDVLALPTEMTLPERVTSKETAARKRSFGEIVDTAALSDDDESTFPIRAPLAARESLNGLLDNTPTQHNVGAFASLKVAPKQSESKLVDESRKGNAGHVSKPAQGLDKIIGTSIALPLNRKKALRRSTYDPRTIARDVLLAIGKHPDMDNLNGHLKQLPNTFKRLEANSDLSTLRWHVIDPGHPLPSDLVNQASQPNQPAGDATNGKVSNSTTLGVELPSKEVKQNVVSTTQHTQQVPAKPQVHKFRVRSPKSRSPKSRSPKHHVRPTAPHTPPAAGSAAPMLAAEKRQASVSSSETRHNSYASFRQALIDSGTPPSTKLGRPVGWRKYPDGAPQQTSQKAGASSSAKKRGSASEAISSPSGGPITSKNSDEPYQVYNCLWQGCGAQLHNMSTLKKHVRKLHCRSRTDEVIRCLWDKCGVEVDRGEKPAQPAPSTGRKMFLHLADLGVHIDKIHLTPIVWSLGDGPTSGLSDHHSSDMSDSYSTDRHGRVSTPRIDVSSDRKQAQDLAQSGPGRPRKTGKQPAVPYQTSLERKKREVGPGIDRGGATLANPRRRLGFLEDADFEEVVE